MEVRDVEACHYGHVPAKYQNTDLIEDFHVVLRWVFKRPDIKQVNAHDDALNDEADRLYPVLLVELNCDQDESDSSQHVN